MKVQMSTNGFLTVTAENGEENYSLHSLYLKQIQEPEAKTEETPEAEPKTGRGHYDRSKIKKRKRRSFYTKHCPVEGCEHKSKGVKLHMLMKHGVQADGTLKDTFLFNGKDYPVKFPVSKVSDGSFVLKDKVDELPDPVAQTTGFLGRVIN